MQEHAKVSKLLIWTMVLAVMVLAIATASLKGWAASAAKESELLYRRKRLLERELGEIAGEVKRLKSPAEIDARIAAMKRGERN